MDVLLRNWEVETDSISVKVISSAAKTTMWFAQHSKWDWAIEDACIIEQEIIGSNTIYASHLKQTLSMKKKYS